MEPLDSVRRALEAMDPEAKRFSASALVVHTFLVVLGYRRLARTSDSQLQGPRWMWRALMPASSITIGDGRITTLPIGVAAFWLLGRKRK